MSSDPATPVQVRHGVPDDAEALAPFAARTFSETFGPDNTADDLADYVSANFTVERLEQELSDASNRFLLAEGEGELAGYAKLRWGAAPESVHGSRPIELSRIYVGGEWLGRGVGQSLMECCLVEAIELGADTIWLGVWERNSRAQAFYRRWGFRQVGTHVFVLGSDPQTDWVMERRL